jgi:hypothetical protein
MRAKRYQGIITHHIAPEDGLCLLPDVIHSSSDHVEVGYSLSRIHWLSGDEVSSVLLEQVERFVAFLFHANRVKYDVHLQPSKSLGDLLLVVIDKVFTSEFLTNESPVMLACCGPNLCAERLRNLEGEVTNTRGTT